MVSGKTAFHKALFLLEDRDLKFQDKPYHMAKTKKSVMMPDELLANKIYLIRGQKVMVDRDLAELYGV